ncbi:MAG TPA: hypothetical protein VG370_24470 [Chloroflexota bacterium]|nr:hypothetical protein [Chloroflexota bacterium]
MPGAGGRRLARVALDSTAVLGAERARILAARPSRWRGTTSTRAGRGCGAQRSWSTSCAPCRTGRPAACGPLLAEVLRAPRWPEVTIAAALGDRAGAGWRAG